jgi:hypothetical protein
MIKFYFLVICQLMLLCFALGCASNRNQNTSQSKLTDEITADTSLTCSFSMSFFSRGGGIDRLAKKDMLNYISSFEKQEKVIVLFEESRWGREGEIDYCFFLSGFSSSNKRKFKSFMNKLSETSGRIAISENKAKRKTLQK